MKINIPLFILYIFSTLTSFSQCYEIGGAGDFELNTLSSHWFSDITPGGTIELSTTEKYSGNKSLHVNMIEGSTWKTRIFGTNSSCYFDKKIGETITFSFYVKGTIGNKMEVILADGNTNDEKEIISLKSSDWTFYLVSLKATTNSSQGNVKIVFRDTGDYYIDQIMVNKYDCYGDIGGLAKLDACDVCSGGNTGLPVLDACNWKTITPNHPNFRYDGALEIDITPEKASFYRMKKSYVITSVPGFYNKDPAQSTSGVEVVFRTKSPKIKAYVAIDADRSSGSSYWSTFEIFRNGEYVNEVNHAKGQNNPILDLLNPTGELSEWKITMPAGTAGEFLKLEIIDGYDLEVVPENNKPVYIAIGNSITQGVGLTYFQTSLTYPHKVANALDMKLYNWGIGGSFIYSEILQNFDEKNLKPKLITVLWGFNDTHFKWDSYFNTTTSEHYQTLLEGLASRFPNACIVPILQIPTNYDAPNEIRTIPALREKQLNIIQELQNTYSNIKHLDGYDYVDASTGLNKDKIHMNEIGNNDLSQGIISDYPCNTIVAKPIIHNTNFNVYPNPTNDIVYWNINQSFVITNIFGKTIWKGEGNQFDFSDQLNGVYFIKTIQGVFKVIKQ